MSSDDPLARLAAAHGIQPAYHDIWGNHHVADATTLRALLTAMGIACDDPARIVAALREVEQRDWRRPLHAVQVVPVAAQPARIPLTLPLETAVLPWRLSEDGGQQHEGKLRVPEDGEQRDRAGLRYRRWHWVLPVELPCGYHRLHLADAELCLIVVPDRCHSLPRGRHWGLALQLYAVRSTRNWGMGDFGDLRRIVERCAALGAATIGLNPLHALYPAEPERASPYSPSSRRWLNPLYLDIDALAEGCAAALEQIADAEFQQELARLRATERVDYPGVAAAKFALLRLLHEWFRQLDGDDPQVRAFRAFQDEHGAALHKQAVFEALHDWFRGLDPAVHGWHDWLPGFRAPDTAVVQRFIAAHPVEIEFQSYLQWLAAEQLHAVAEHARRRGLKLGLYRDLAVGADSVGGETWAEPGLYADGARVGAPPDDFSPGGQDWGLPPPVPDRLRESAYAPFIATLRSNMRCAGILRIDHVMALSRLFWIPPDGQALDGAYVSYPLNELLGIVALESQRQACAVIGEDLGTVPNELRAALHRAGVLSYRPLYFEKHWNEDGRFKAAAEFPDQALVTAATHDLPTLAGFWAERDIDWRERLGLFPRPDMAARQRAERAADRERLLAVLADEHLLPAGCTADGDFTPALALAIQTFLARTPVRLMMIQAEDLCGQLEQVNLPGTVDQHPNWCRKLPLELEDWLHGPELETLAGLLRPCRSAIPVR